jgi:hypothetical protein
MYKKRKRKDPVIHSLSSAIAAAPLVHLAGNHLLLAAFSSIISDGSTTPAPLHSVQHIIVTSGQPGFTKS